MAVTKAVLCFALTLAVLELAAGNVNSLYSTPGEAGAHPHHHEAADAQGTGQVSTNFDSAGSHSARVAAADTQAFQTTLQQGAGSAHTFGRINDGRRADAPARQQGSQSPSSVQGGAVGGGSLGQEAFGSSSRSGDDLGTQSGQRQDGSNRASGAPREAESFPTLFQGDITRSLSPSSQRDREIASQVSGVDGSRTRQQNGGLVFATEGQRTDGVVAETFPGAGLGTDAARLAPALVGGSAPAGAGARFISAEDFATPAEVTITTDVTIDRFTTLTNLAYNSVPVTLTEFVKVTLTAPTFQTVTTPVDDMVLVSRVPVTRIDTITVTDTNTGHQYATEVSTVLYTITHKLYDIRQQTITSLVVQTQLVRPRVVSTRIETEYETQTQLQTVTNTVLLDAPVPRSGPVPTAFGARYGSYQ